MDALLTDGSSRIAYSALRSLTELGLRVAVADTSKTGMCQWSRLPGARYLYAPPMTQPEAYVADINRILAETGAKFLLPGYEDAEVLAKYRDRLPANVTLPVASFESISLGNDKFRMGAFARGLGVPIPETIEYADLSELESRLRETGWDVVVKLRRGNSAKGVYYPRGPEETVARCAQLISDFKLKPDRYPMVQRKVYGRKWTVSAVYFEGKELAFFTQKMLREKPATGGTSTYRVSVRDDRIEDYARRILEGINFHGIAMVEFKQMGEEDDFWFIELNPRLWGAISHSVAAGCDMVKLLYTAHRDGFDKARCQVRPYTLGMHSRWLLGDAILAFSELKQREWLKAIKLLTPGGAEDYDEFKADDPTAFAGEIAYFIGKAARQRSTEPIAEEGAFG